MVFGSAFQAYGQLLLVFTLTGSPQVRGVGCGEVGVER